ncbi:MAG: primase alpha helix C-terminal domain-containing protein [Sandaracinaceae bacterium]|nr:primase alpha helix C-terminal domain-containing protein [Sandaracinaceae bacterium]
MSLSPPQDHHTDSPDESNSAQIPPFLAAMFAGIPGFVNVWRLATKTSQYFATDQLPAATALIKTLGATEDTYIGVATRRENFGSIQRGTQSQLASLPALWFDADIFNSAHRKTTLPLTEDEVIAFLNELPLAPSIIVRSGHGFHVYWLLLKALDLTRPATLAHATRLSKSFQRHIIARGRERGWEFDDTSDLPRILRVPGTNNLKQEPVVPVRLVELHAERRYEVAQVELAMCLDESDASRGKAAFTDEDVLAAIEAGVEEGNRDAFLFRFACIRRDEGGDRAEVEDEVIEAAGRCKPPFPRNEARKKVTRAFKKAPAARASKPNVSELLIECADGIELFHDQEDAYAQVQVANHFEIHPVAGSSFRELLTRRLYERHKKAAPPDVLTTATLLLAAHARYEGEQRSVYLRVAEVDGAIYLDLADELWRVVEVTAAGWRIVDNSPVMFRRPPAMRALPTPERGGSINELRSHVNLPDEQQWKLFVVFLLATMRTSVPFPVLAVHGPNDSAKSTLVRNARMLIDPNRADLRLAAHSVDDLLVTAMHSWLVCFDNMSGVSNPMSDAICMISTGGGLAKRLLYTNGEEFVVQLRRPIVINGIDDVAVRHDLADRTLVLTLPSITNKNRRSAKTLAADFELARPRILGALLDGLSCALANADTFSDVEPIARMHDFTILGLAASAAFGWDPASFVAAHRANHQEATERANDADVVVAALRAFADREGTWSGTMSELHHLLSREVGEEVARSRAWPQASNSLSVRIKRIEHGLAAVGIKLQFLPRVGGQKPICISRMTDADDTAQTPLPFE